MNRTTAKSSWQFFPHDLIVLAYTALMVLLIILFGEPTGIHSGPLIFYLGVIALTLLIVRYFPEGDSRWWAFIRIGYPALLFTFFYRTTGGLMTLFHHRFFDAKVTALETSIFGVSPSLYIDQHLTGWRWLNELLSFGYFSYYFMILGLLLLILFRRQYRVMASTVTALCTAFFISYLVFVLYPVESPRWFYAAHYIEPIHGWIFRSAVVRVIGQAGLHGGGMPSSHVGVALVIMFYSLRYYYKFGLALIPLNILLAAGTMWGRFHYLSDVVTGIMVGIVPVLIVWHYYDNRRKDMEATGFYKEVENS